MMENIEIPIAQHISSLRENRDGSLDPYTLYNPQLLFD